jgi:hypothetical protein
MAGTVENVTNILRNQYRWTATCAPAPQATETALIESDEEAVAFTLDGYVNGIVAAGIPWNVKPEDGYEWACRQVFTINQKYWEYNTQLALGFIVEPPVDTIGQAQSATQWWNHQELLRNRLGELLCAQEEFDRRKAYVNLVPLEWSMWPGGPMIYQLAVREGYMPVGMMMFDPAYLQTNPKLDEVRGLDATQWLQNLQADSARKPRPWLPGGAANPAVQ